MSLSSSSSIVMETPTLSDLSVWVHLPVQAVATFMFVCLSASAFELHFLTYLLYASQYVFLCFTSLYSRTKSVVTYWPLVWTSEWLAQLFWIPLFITLLCFSNIYLSATMRFSWICIDENDCNRTARRRAIPLDSSREKTDSSFSFPITIEDLITFWARSYESFSCRWIIHTRKIEWNASK